jgi:hypothetical protein
MILDADALDAAQTYKFRQLRADAARRSGDDDDFSLGCHVRSFSLINRTSAHLQELIQPLRRSDPVHPAVRS